MRRTICSQSSTVALRPQPTPAMVTSRTSAQRGIERGRWAEAVARPGERARSGSDKCITKTHVTTCTAGRQIPVHADGTRVRALARGRAPPAARGDAAEWPKGRGSAAALDAARSRRKPLVKSVENWTLEQARVVSSFAAMAPNGVDGKAGDFLRKATLAESSGARAKYATRGLAAAGDDRTMRAMLLRQLYLSH